MTMLDRMRRRIGWLKWILALVILAFIVFYVPDFMRQSDAAGPSEVVARVGGQSITVAEFQRVYQAQLARYREAYGGSMSDQLLRQMGIDQQILQQMIEERAAAAEARRLGLRVSDAELAQRIYTLPMFQRDGQFAGRDAYQRVLRSLQPPLSVAEFETSMRRFLLIQKLRAAVTDWITVPDAEVEREFRRRNEKVRLELVLFSADGMRREASVSDEELAAYFERHPDNYREPEKRKIRYLLVDTDAVKARTNVPAEDVARAYRENIEQYTTPEQVRASHILLKTEDEDAAAVRQKAETLLTRARGGADFAALAREHSQDEGSASQGGDLDYFGRGRMVKEFEDAAFALEPGQISDIVESPFGLHIIKVVDRKAAITRSLDEVRDQIAEQLAWERAQAEASTLATGLEPEIRRTADLDRVAKARGLEVQESEYFGREDVIPGLGPAPGVTSQAFELQEDQTAGPVRVARGFVFFATVGKQDAQLPELDAVKDRVREDAVREKAAELASARAAELAGDLRTDFQRTARRAGIEIQTSDLVPRGAVWPGAGISTALDAAVFALPVGGVTEPIATDAGVVVARVAEREDVDAAALAAGRDVLRDELLQTERMRFFEAYMQKARERIRTDIDQEMVRRVTSPRAGFGA